MVGNRIVCIFRWLILCARFSRSFDHLLAFSFNIRMRFGFGRTTRRQNNIDGRWLFVPFFLFTLNERREREKREICCVNRVFVRWQIAEIIATHLRSTDYSFQYPKSSSYVYIIIFILRFFCLHLPGGKNAVSYNSDDLFLKNENKYHATNNNSHRHCRSEFSPFFDCKATVRTTKCKIVHNLT